MAETAKRVALATLIVIAIVATALALWKLKLVLALIFLGFILAAAMRPGIDWLGRRGVPRGVGSSPLRPTGSSRRREQSISWHRS